jgi:hypothetical protein
MIDRSSDNLAPFTLRLDRGPAKNHQRLISDCWVVVRRKGVNVFRPRAARCICLLSFVVLFLGACAVILVGPYDEVTDQAITDLAYRTEAFLTRMEATGAPYHGNEAFYYDAKARLRATRLRAALYPKNTGELELMDNLSKNLDNLADLHRTGPLTGIAGEVAWKELETNFQALLQVELAKKRSSGVSAAKT